MKLPAREIVGRTSGPFGETLDARWVMAYSAALGETDPRCYDTEAGSGPRVHPVFPVCYEWPAAQPLRALPALAPLQPRLIHAQHDLVIHRPLRAGEAVSVSARIIAAEQRSPGTLVLYRFATAGPDGGKLTTSDFGVLYRGVQLTEPVPAVERFEDPPAPTGALEPAGELRVAATAAHVYTECARIWNPIHTDRAYAHAAGLPDIVLHGTATLALSVSALLGRFSLDMGAVRRVRCRFSGMVLMPSVLGVHARREGGALAFETRDARGEPVIRRGQLLLA